MVGKTRTTTLGTSKNKISQIVGKNYNPKQNINFPALL